MRGLLITLALMLSAQGAMACSLAEVPNWRDRPVEVASDGSFDHADADPYIQLFGGKIVDLGEQKVAQRISQSGSCDSLYERLLFADCRTSEVVFVDGLEEPPGASFGPYFLIESVQVPIGAIDVRKVSSVAELVSIAHENNYTVSLNVERSVAQMKRRNRYDPFNGCKIYYPESHGATG